MSNSYVQVPPNSTGTKMQTYENVVGINTVDSEAVTLTRSSDNTEVGTASQPLRVDPVGTTSQPVSGSVSITGGVSVSGTLTANQGTASASAKWSVQVDNSSAISVADSAAESSLASIVSALSNPLPVHDSSPASQAVTNVGTFAVQATTKTALTPAAPTATSVGITSASAVAANASRKGLVLTNTSGGTISLGFGSAAVLNSGITLSSGGSFEMDEYTFYAGAVYAIASGAASNLAIQEYST